MSGKRAQLLAEVHRMAAEHHGVVTRDELTAVGIHDSWISRAAVRGDIVRLAPGSYLVPTLVGALSHLAAALRSYPLAVASHRAAAFVWRLDGIDALELDLLCPSGAAPRLGILHVSRDLQRLDVRTVAGLRVTDPTRTLCDLGAVCEPDVVERAMESALRRGLTSVKRLEWRCGQMRRRGRQGPATLADLLQRRSTTARPTESELETRYLQVLREHGVPLPVRQHRVFHEGRFLGRADHAYPDQKVFVELDGWAYHGTREAFERDRARQNDLVAAGWSPLRFTWTDVNERPAETARRTLDVLLGSAA